MSPDDPRHGKNAGYQAHRMAGQTPCDACRLAHSTEHNHRRNNPRPMVDAVGVHRRIRALHRLGWSGAEISRRCGRSQFWTQQVLLKQRVYQGTFDAIAALYDELSMTWCATDRGRRVAAEARAKGWPPPLAWDDEDLDDPAASPYANEEPVDVDDVVVERVLAGEWKLPTTKAEKVEIARRWHAAGGTLYRLAAVTGWKTERYIRVGEAA